MSRKKINTEIPTFDDLIIPTVKALLILGGSGSVEEINTKVYEIASIPESVLELSHGEEGTMSEVDYRLAWSRTYLKKYGLLENSARGVWALSNAEIDINKIDVSKIKRLVREQSKSLDKNNIVKKSNNKVIENTVEEVENTEEWKDRLLNILYKIPSDAFERLSQRLLRESGFSQVDVTGKTNDGGIDGKGIVRISGLLSFHVIFQCKRFKGSVGSNVIRDFRGAMQGRADKGLIITTGIFTKEAIKEATRDGAPPIDLINGELLCTKLRELKLGIDIKTIEVIEIKSDWFNNL